MGEGPWYCTRQRAGPLVKECRAIRPRLAGTDSLADRRDKNELIRSPHSAVCRSQADRLELRLALFGFEGSHYTLTYDDLHLPRTFREAMATKRAFMARARRWHKGEPFDWIACVEGLHGDHRYHIHLVLRDSDFPVLLPTGGYRRLAEYLTKERTDGVIIPIGRRPWNCSRSLGRQLPPPERWRDESGVIQIPDDVLWSRRGDKSNSFGAYSYASYIKGNSFLICRAQARAHARPSILKPSGTIDTRR